MSRNAIQEKQLISAHPESRNYFNIEFSKRLVQVSRDPVIQGAPPAKYAHGNFCCQTVVHG